MTRMAAKNHTDPGKAKRNAAYLAKLDRGLAQVRAGQGIVKTMEELEAMVKDSPTHKTLEERLIAFYGMPIEEIERIQNQKENWGPAQGEEIICSDEQKE